MENTKEVFSKRTDKDKDDPTKPFPNSEKPSAAIVNRSENKPARNYKKAGGKVNGPDFDKQSKDVDGDTTVNAGVFK